MARTSMNVPVASAVTARARFRSSWWPCRSTTVLLVAVCCPDRGLMLVAFMITTPVAGWDDLFVGAGSEGLCAPGPSASPLGRSAGPACRGCGGRYAGRVVQEAEDFGVQPLRDLGGRCVTVGRDRAGDGVVGHLGSAACQFLDEDGDRRVGAARARVAAH